MCSREFWFLPTLSYNWQVSTIFGCHVWFCLSVGPSCTVIRFTSNKDQNVPLCPSSMSGACSTAHWWNRPDHWDGLMLDRSAVLLDDFRPYPVEHNGSDCWQVSKIRPSQCSGLFDWWAVEHATVVTRSGADLCHIFVFSVCSFTVTVSLTVGILCQYCRLLIHKIRQQSSVCHVLGHCQQWGQSLVNVLVKIL